MAVPDAEIANQFRAALEEAVGTGDLEAVYPLLVEDVEWVTPQRTLHGLDEVKEQLDWIKPSETFDFEFSEGDWVDQGDGRLVLEVREVYRLKETGDFGYAHDRRVELTIRDGKISRYEMRIVG
jgi:ketosteroid isomerase-like protein